MHSTTKLQLRELNPHLLCVLCGGYLIDATTIIECIHSFCRTCIIKYLESSKYCPICDVQVHKTKPLLNVRSDKTLQTLVYKLVPSLFKDEMRRRREFYAAHPDQGIQSTRSLNASELRGEAELGDDFSSKKDEEQISLCLQSCAKLPPYQNEHLCSARTLDNGQILDRRYLLCPSSVTIGHLKKLIKSKFDLPPTYRVDIFYSDEGLRDTYTLLDVAHIYAWRRVEPLKLYYIVHDRSLSQLQLSPPSVKNTSRSSRDHRPVNKRSISLYTIRMSVSDTENTDSQTAKPETNDTLPKAEVQSVQSTNCSDQSSVPDGGGTNKQSIGSEQNENVNSSEKPDVISDVDGEKETETAADGEKGTVVDGQQGDSVDISGCGGVKDNRDADWSTSVSSGDDVGAEKSEQNDEVTCKQTNVNKNNNTSTDSHCETGVNNTTYHQTGNNKQSINQTGNSKQSINQTGNSKQSINHQTGNSKQSIDQTGNSKQSINHQTGNSKQSINHQTGNNKQSINHQTGNSKQSINHQTGNNKQSINHQTGNNKQSIDQTGNNKQSINQTGNSKQSINHQTGNSKQSIDQTGNSKQSIDQTGNSKQSIDQTGNSKQSINHQTGNSKQSIDQTGNSKQSIDQTGNSKQSIDQTGNSKQSIDQTGNSKQSIDQTGNSKQSIDQTGNSKQSIDQTGNSKQSIDQTGNSKQSIDQTGNSKQSIDQTGNSKQSNHQSHQEKDENVDDQNEGRTRVAVVCAQTDDLSRTETAIRKCEDPKVEVGRSTGVDSATPSRILSARTNNNNKLVYSDKIVCSAGGGQTIADGRLLRKAGLLAAAREPTNGSQRWLVPNRNQIQRCPRLVAMAGGRSVFLVSSSGAPCPGTLTAASVALVGQPTVTCSSLTGGQPVVTCSTLTGGQPAIGLAGNGQQRFAARKNNHVINSRPAHACDSADAVLNGTPPNGEIRPTNGTAPTTAKIGGQLPAEVDGQQIASDTNTLKLANGRESITVLNRKRSRRDENVDCASNKTSKISRCSVGLDDPEQFRKVGVNMALEKHVTPQA